MTSLSDAPVLIVGCNETALRAIEALRDYGRRVAGCTVEDRLFGTAELDGATVVPLSHAQKVYPPQRCVAFVAVGSGDNNHARKRLCEMMKGLGYGLTSVIAPHAHIGHRVSLGQNVFVMDGAFVGPGTVAADGVTIWSGVNLSHLADVGAYAWLAPSASFAGGCTIGPFAFVGLNATVLLRIVIGREALVGAGCVLTHDADDYGVYAGVPGRKIGDSRQSGGGIAPVHSGWSLASPSSVHIMRPRRRRSMDTRDRLHRCAPSCGWNHAGLACVAFDCDGVRDSSYLTSCDAHTYGNTSLFGLCGEAGRRCSSHRMVRYGCV